MTTTSSMAYQRCSVCAWRRRLIKTSDDDTDAPLWACDSAEPVILKGLHQKPSQVWIDIISTDRLCSPSLPVMREGRAWVSIPLRCFTTVQHSNMYDGCWQHPQDTVIGFHNTKLESLVEPTPSWTGIPNSYGILWDGRLRYGSCTHDTHKGVNLYSDGGLETFDDCTGWVQLEVRCTNTTKLRGGRNNRYCVSGPSGDICNKVAIVALLVPLAELPSIVFLS